MPSPVYHVTPLPAESMQYTGSNSADFPQQVPDVTITSEVGNVLTLDHLGTPIVLHLNHWIVWNTFQMQALNVNQYTTEWGCFAPCEVVETVSTLEVETSTLESDLATAMADIAALQATVAGLSIGTPVRSVGVAPVGALLLNASTTIPVTLTPAMPDTSYTPHARLFAGISITGLQINSVTVVSTSVVDVVVQSVGVATLAGANVMVSVND